MCRNESVTIGCFGHITCHTIQKQASLQSTGMAYRRHNWSTDLEAILYKDGVPVYSLRGGGYVHNGKYTWVQEQRSRSRRPTYHGCQRPCGGLCALIPGTLGSVELEVQVLKGSIVFPWDIARSHRTSLQLLPGHSALLGSRNQQAVWAMTWLSLRICHSTGSVWFLQGSHWRIKWKYRSHLCIL